MGFEEGRGDCEIFSGGFAPSPRKKKNPHFVRGWETSALINPALEKPLPLKPVRGEAIALDIPALLTS